MEASKGYGPHYEPQLPLVILGGRDRRSTRLPEAGRDHRPLGGFKAVEVRIGGRSLIEILVQRMHATGAFSAIYIAGPGDVYGGLGLDVGIIETDGEFGENLLTIADFLARQHSGEQAMFTTCDIVPDPAELRVALDDYFAHRPVDFWMLQHPVPEAPGGLGQSAWKPKYRLRRRGEPEATRVIPGHLLAVAPETTHCALVCRILDAFYRSRNRSIPERGWVVLQCILRELVAADWREVRAGRWPTVSVHVVYHSLGLARLLAKGTATLEDFEHRLRPIFYLPTHRRRHRDRLGRVAILECYSLAKDIDTVEEAREVQATTSA